MELDLMGYKVYAGRLEDIDLLERKQVINTINAYSYVRAESEPHFKQALLNSDVLLADGFPVVLAAKILKRKKIVKIAGEDLFFHMMRVLDMKKGSCFFLGASESTLSKIVNRLSFEFPDVRAAYYSPPFKPEFGNEDVGVMVDRVNSFGPDVLFVGLTAPKQEKLVESFKGEIDAKAICSIGAVFDFYAGTNKRPSRFWIRLRLEWFIRLLKEPSRLWKRYLVYSPLFFYYVAKYKFRGTNASR